jgi:hypothetical protein
MVCMYKKHTNINTKDVIKNKLVHFFIGEH